MATFGMGGTGTYSICSGSVQGANGCVERLSLPNAEGSRDFALVNLGDFPLLFP